jgi:peroxin-4
MTHNLGAVKRLRKELQNLERGKKKNSRATLTTTTTTTSASNTHNYNENDDIFLRPTNPSKSILHWTALLRGPPDSPYENGIFQLSIICKSDYPLVAPNMTFQTKVFHPNVHFKTGDICLDILKKEWSPAWGLQAACRAVVALLSDPDASSPLNCDAGNLVRGNDMSAFWGTARMYTIENAMLLDWPKEEEEAKSER